MKPQIILNLTLMIALLLSAGCSKTQPSGEDRTSYARAHTLYLGKKFEKSRDILEKLCEKYPDWLEAHVLFARAHYQEKSFKKAENKLKNYLETHGENPFALLWLGKTLMLQEGKLQEAVNVFRQIIKNDPENSRAYYHLGICLELQNKKRSARLAWKRAAAAEITLGKTYLRLVKYATDRRIYLDKAKRLNPTENDLLTIESYERADATEPLSGGESGSNSEARR